MQPSSLVFALVVGLWAAYLLPQWVRRRESLGASRTGDRHSERLRILDRRRPSPTATGPSSRPLLSGPRVAAAVTASDVAPVRAGARATGRPEPLRGRTARAGSPAARRRASVLVALVLLTAASWVLVALPALVVPVWAAAPATALLGLDLLALRAAARRGARRAERLARATRRSAELAREETDDVDDLEDGAEVGGSGRILAGRPPAPASRGRTVRPAGASVRSAAAASGRSVSARPAAVAAAARTDWSDRRWEDETGPLVAVERPNPLDPDDGWQPVAVPPPTYTLKPVVPWPTVSTWQAERDFADDLDLDAVLARRRAVNG